MVADENSQTAETDEFELLHYVASKRLQNGHLTVVDATNVQTEARRLLVQLAKKYHCLPVAIVLDVPEKVAMHEMRKDWTGISKKMLLVISAHNSVGR